MESNFAKLSWHSDLRTEYKNPFQPGMPGMGYFGNRYRGPGYAVDSAIVLDERGHVLRSTGDYPLPAPLGELVQSIYPPLPARPGSSAAIKDEAQIMDAPALEGPIHVFSNPSGFSPGPYLGYGQHLPAALALSREVVWQIAASGDEVITLNQHTHLQSYLQSGADPRLDATADAKFQFNQSDGLFQGLEVTAELTSVTETTSRKSKIYYTCRRLTGPELAAALAPPAPFVQPKLSELDLQKITGDLKSDDAGARQMALFRLSAATVDSPSPELMALVTAALTDSNIGARQPAMNFVAGHATKEQVPLLLKFLNDSDYGVRQNAIKALARLRDERAIQPLVDLVARSGSSDQDAVSTLTGFGSVAEKAVLTLFNERSTETRRQACAILQQIGTQASLEALQKQVGDSEQSVSQAASQAIQAITERQ